MLAVNNAKLSAVPGRSGLAQMGRRTRKMRPALGMRGGRGGAPGSGSSSGGAGRRMRSGSAQVGWLAQPVCLLEPAGHNWVLYVSFADWGRVAAMPGMQWVGYIYGWLHAQSLQPDLAAPCCDCPTRRLLQRLSRARRQRRRRMRGEASPLSPPAASGCPQSVCRSCSWCGSSLRWVGGWVCGWVERWMSGLLSGWVGVEAVGWMAGWQGERPGSPEAVAACPP